MARKHVDLMAAMLLLQRHLTAAVCSEVFETLRDQERSRLWTLEAMLDFWTAVVIRAPKSLREALDECFAAEGGYPDAGGSRSSFFERAQTLRWHFFRGVFDRFISSLLADCPRTYEQATQAALPAFPEVWVADGSALARVARRLKAVRSVKEIVVPGSIIALYDLFRGIPRRVFFYEKLLGGEAMRLRENAAEIPAGTLVVCDRGYSSLRLLSSLADRGVHALIRLKRNIVAVTVQELSRNAEEGVTDRIVLLGTGQGTPKLKARLIEKRLPNGDLLRLATDVLDPARLPAAAALDLYRRRWGIERMFDHLKSVLNLKRFYAANTNAVAMQVYASAIVYAAMRAAQALLARELRRRPEELSPGRLFPRIAAAHVKLLYMLAGFEAVKRANPQVDLVEPDWKRVGPCRIAVERLLVRRRKGARGKNRAYSKARTRVVPLRPLELKHAKKRKRR